MLQAIPWALDGRILTREGLAETVARLTGAAYLSEKLRDGFGTLLKPAADRGDIYFARPDHWLGGWKLMDPSLALQEVTRRLLDIFGPATRDLLARGRHALPSAD